MLDLAFVTHLGDFIDRDFESFDEVNSIYNQLKMPKRSRMPNSRGGQSNMPNGFKGCITHAAA
ncbi:MAG: hypothetical protein ACJAU9_001352 [Lentimonas sp.]|jgi:hypothetical protein